jgi:8-hydroxy-5-deazaflavin:NADPH oxidoreductase
MKIAFIGAGNVGRALATSSIRAGHAVTITATDVEKAAAVADELGATPARSNREAAEAAEAVVLAVPYEAIDEVLNEIADAVAGKIVVDVTNRVDPSDWGATIDGTSAAEEIRSRVPEARVVKAFNTLFASQQADPVVEGVELDAFVAGDDEDAKRSVLELARSIGSRPIDAGPLRMARALEAMAQLNIMLNMQNQWSWESGWKLVGPSGSAA